VTPTESAAAGLLAPTEALTRGFVHSPVPGAGAALPAQRAAATQHHETRQGIRVGPLRLMLRYEDGSELTEMPTVYRLPNAPTWLPGVANLHGMLVPVFDLAAWLGMPAGASSKPMLLVLSQGADAAGVVIDGLPQRLRWSADDITGTESAPPALAALLRGAALLGGQLWFDLDCAALLRALEGGLGASS
jgi:twitching motility protein PilI